MYGTTRFMNFILGLLSGFNYRYLKHYVLGLSGMSFNLGGGGGEMIAAVV